MSNNYINNNNYNKKINKKYRLRAGCILIIDKNKNLFLSVSNKKGTEFNLPGGKIEKYESFTDGTIRELKEETGLIVNKSDMKLFHQDYEFSCNLKWFVITYISFNWSGEIYTEETGIVKWLPLEELKNSHSYKKYNSILYEKYINKYLL